MENYQLILNSNSLCVICLSEMEAKLDKADLFPLHHLISKINSNLGDVFKDVAVPWAPNAVMDRLEVLAYVCEGCVDLCEELLYKFQDEVGRENCIKLILDKMKKVGMEDKYKQCGSPVAVFYTGIVDRLRKEIIEIFHLKPELGGGSNQSGTGSSAGLNRIPNLLCIPDLPMSQICSYLSFRDVSNCSTVSKDLRRLVLPSFIKSSSIQFKEPAQLTAIIDFIKTISNNLKKNVNLSIRSKSLCDSPFGTGSNLRQLFQECSRHIDCLSISYCNTWRVEEVFCCSRDKNWIPALKLGKELFPNLKKLEFNYSFLRIDFLRRSAEDRENDFLAFVKVLLQNSPNLRELKLFHSVKNDVVIPSLFKLIGESGLPIDSLEVKELHITGSEMGNLGPLNLKKVVINACLNLNDMTGWTNFLESQSATLKHLRLDATNTLPHFTFPRMESLETFELNTIEIETNKELGPISYQNQMPKLKKLEVRGVNEIDLLKLLPSEATPTTSVKELTLLGLFRRLEKEILVRATRLFVSLSKLEIPVSSYLNDFWKDLSGLEELTLHPKHFGGDRSENAEEKITWIDKIITGLPLNTYDCEGVTNIRRHEKRYEKMETKKSLALLTRLKLFRICNSKWDYESSPNLLLSDICCKVVLIKMESLKCIDFCGSHPSSVGASRKVLDEMGKKMDLFFGKERKRIWIE